MLSLFLGLLGSSLSAELGSSLGAELSGNASNITEPVKLTLDPSVMDGLCVDYTTNGAKIPLLGNGCVKSNWMATEYVKTDTRSYQWTQEFEVDEPDAADKSEGEYVLTVSVMNFAKLDPPKYKIVPRDLSSSAADNGDQVVDDQVRGEGLVLDFEQNALGSITKVNILNGGTGYKAPLITGTNQHTVLGNFDLVEIDYVGDSTLDGTVNAKRVSDKKGNYFNMDIRRVNQVGAVTELSLIDGGEAIPNWPSFHRPSEFWVTDWNGVVHKPEPRVVFDYDVEREDSIRRIAAYVYSVTLSRPPKEGCAREHKNVKVQVSQGDVWGLHGDMTAKQIAVSTGGVHSPRTAGFATAAKGLFSMVATMQRTDATDLIKTSESWDTVPVNGELKVAWPMASNFNLRMPVQTKEKEFVHKKLVVSVKGNTEELANLNCIKYPLSTKSGSFDNEFFPYSDTYSYNMGRETRYCGVLWWDSTRAGACRETALVSTPTDKQACESVTALKTPTACEAIELNHDPACTYNSVAQTCSETASTPVGADTAACLLVQGADLSDATVCEAVQKANKGKACTYNGQVPAATTDNTLITEDIDLRAWAAQNTLRTAPVIYIPPPMAFIKDINFTAAQKISIADEISVFDKSLEEIECKVILHPEPKNGLSHVLMGDRGEGYPENTQARISEVCDDGSEVGTGAAVAVTVDVDGSLDMEVVDVGENYDEDCTVSVDVFFDLKITGVVVVFGGSGLQATPTFDGSSIGLGLSFAMDNDRITGVTITSNTKVFQGPSSDPSGDASGPCPTWQDIQSMMTIDADEKPIIMPVCEYPVKRHAMPYPVFHTETATDKAPTCRFTTTSGFGSSERTGGSWGCVDEDELVGLSIVHQQDWQRTKKVQVGGKNYPYAQIRRKNGNGDVFLEVDLDVTENEPAKAQATVVNGKMKVAMVAKGKGYQSLNEQDNQNVPGHKKWGIFYPAQPQDVSDVIVLAGGHGYLPGKHLLCCDDNHFSTVTNDFYGTVHVEEGRVRNVTHTTSASLCKGEIRVCNHPMAFRVTRNNRNTCEVGTATLDETSSVHYHFGDPTGTSVGFGGRFSPELDSNGQVVGLDVLESPANIQADGSEEFFLYPGSGVVMDEFLQENFGIESDDTVRGHGAVVRAIYRHETRQDIEGILVQTDFTINANGEVGVDVIRPSVLHFHASELPVEIKAKGGSPEFYGRMTALHSDGTLDVSSVEITKRNLGNELTFDGALQYRWQNQNNQSLGNEEPSEPMGWQDMQWFGGNKIGDGTNLRDRGWGFTMRHKDGANPLLMKVDAAGVSSPVSVDRVVVTSDGLNFTYDTISLEDAELLRINLRDVERYDGGNFKDNLKTGQAVQGPHRGVKGFYDSVYDLSTALGRGMIGFHSASFSYHFEEWTVVQTNGSHIGWSERMTVVREENQEPTRLRVCPNKNETQWGTAHLRFLSDQDEDLGAMVVLEFSSSRNSDNTNGWTVYDEAAGAVPHTRMGAVSGEWFYDESERCFDVRVSLCSTVKLYESVVGRLEVTTERTGECVSYADCPTATKERAALSANMNGNRFRQCAVGFGQAEFQGQCYECDADCDCNPGQFCYKNVDELDDKWLMHRTCQKKENVGKMCHGAAVPTTTHTKLNATHNILNSICGGYEFGLAGTAPRQLWAGNCVGQVCRECDEGVNTCGKAWTCANGQFQWTFTPSQYSVQQGKVSDNSVIEAELKREEVQDERAMASLGTLIATLVFVVFLSFSVCGLTILLRRRIPKKDNKIAPVFDDISEESDEDDGK